MAVQTHNKKPPAALVLGAGVMGLCVATILQRQGMAVTLCDPQLKGDAKSGFTAPLNASAMAGGMLSPYAEIDHMPAGFIKAGLESITLWDTFLPPGHVKRNGSIILAHAEDRHMLQRFKTLLEPLKSEVVFSDLQSLNDCEPGLAGRFSEGLILDGEAHLDPIKAMAYLLSEMKDVRGEAYAPADALKQCSLVIDCRGLSAAGDIPNLRGVKGEITLVRNPNFNLQRPVRLMHPRYPFYIVPRGDGIFAVGATQIEGHGNNAVSVRSALELLSAVYSLHPSFADAEILELTAAARPTLPSNLPEILIDDLPQGRIIRCNGLFRHGWLLAPVMAECVADLTQHKTHRFLSLFMPSLAPEKISEINDDRAYA